MMFVDILQITLVFGTFNKKKKVAMQITKFRKLFFVENLRTVFCFYFVLGQDVIL